MKFTKTSGLLALGLAGHATADSYTVTGAANSWDSGKPSIPAIPTSTTTVTATTTVTNVSTSTITATTTSTTTETVTKEATTVYRSTVYVAPGFCTSTVVNVDGKPFPPGGGPPAAPTGAAPAAGSWQPPAPVSPAQSTGVAPAGGNGGAPAWPADDPATGTINWAQTATITGDWGKTTTASASKTTITSVDPTKPEDGSWIDWANEVSTVGTDADVWSWTVDVTTVTFDGPAPTYTLPWDGGDSGASSNGNGGSGGNGGGSGGGSGGQGGTGGQGGGYGNGTSNGNSTLPVPGSSGSNVTAPYLPLKEGSCNTAADRSKWCNGQSISTVTYTAGYKSGSTCSYDFTITNTTMNLDGSGSKLAFAINGQVPGPVIECNWGDILQVTVHNQLQDNSTTIHWHGSCPLPKI